MKAGKNSRRGLLVVVVFTIVFMMYSTVGERYLLVNRKIPIILQENSNQSIRIVQFSDTHLGKFFSLKQLQKVVNKINEQSPDLVFFTGDLFDIMEEYKNIDEVIMELSKIDATIGKFAIMGNRDYQYGENFFTQKMKKAGFSVLNNDSTQIAYKDKIVSIYGLSHFFFDPSRGQALLEGMDENHINLLLMHEPDIIKDYAQYPIDVAFAGHSHGGQVLVPFIGPIARTNLCEDYFKGKYELENRRKTTFYVSSGIGNTKVPFRLGNIPEIIIFDIKF